MTERQGMFTIPTRLYLTEAHRARLEWLVREQEADLSDWISKLVADYLETLPDAPPPAQPPEDDRRVELRKRRMELNRLRARRDSDGTRAPAWLNSYIADLEAEISRLSDGL